MSEYILEMRNITKVFPGVVANDRVNLKVRKGEIHGLLGENGAGKTTLMSILYGLYKPDSGEIIFDGKKRVFNSPKDAIEAGIGMVHQHFKLVNKMTALDNIILGYKTPNDPLVDYGWARERIKEIMEKSKIDVDLDEIVVNMSVGEEQRVEILKSLMRDVKLLILDEPTSVLTPSETEKLFVALKSMKEKGLTVLFITHKLREALELTDRITVLRKGRNVGTIVTSETNEKELAKMMVGREIKMEFRKSVRNYGRDVLVLKDVYARDDRGLMALKGINLSVREGEILGIAGVSGNGQRELEEIIVGVRDIERGAIYFDGKRIDSAGVYERIQLGISCIPEDRINSGLALSLTIADNLVLRDYRKFCRKGIIDFSNIEAHAERLVKEYDIKTPSVHALASTLSGGNMQRLIIAREFSRNPRLLIASQPTRGLDIAGIEYVRKKLIQFSEEGKAVILISEDLDEIVEMSDRIAVIYEGQIRGIFEEPDMEKIGILMSGGEINED
ncbi:nucleoside ABC transporter ATP-binding protein [Archaeoglobus sulfaticallidus PM70-1]|uniref:Nucleoside ABC transporter ATP-binding protein n=1 Tax=Archaeoglobus sulfaticallidus PM70-1 TaxID=387631 RepID=N0BIE2_9EURY|nr:nucleoside ABC transporter ATP-binding protein [Archaeoglobus sulfaticallidus PM70-1]